MGLSSGRRLLVCAFLFHFFLILTVSCRDTFAIIGQGYTFLPKWVVDHAAIADIATSAALGQTLPMSNNLRQSVNSYMHSAGIDRGYGLFSPGVPNSYKLVFELHFPDGRTEYALPEVNGDESGFRLVTLLDYIGRTTYDPLRQVMLEMLAYRVWQDHPKATMIRAVFGDIKEPTSLEALNGKKETYHFLHAYDFSFTAEATEQSGR